MANISRGYHQHAAWVSDEAEVTTKHYPGSTEPHVISVSDYPMALSLHCTQAALIKLLDAINVYLQERDYEEQEKGYDPIAKGG